MTSRRSLSAVLFACGLTIAASWFALAQPARAGGSGVKLEVHPKDAEVFVDGAYVGIVDDFDGFFQQLSLPPGQYEIALYLKGHRTVRQRVDIAPGATYRLRCTMEALVKGEPDEPRPVAASPPAPSAPAAPSGFFLEPPRPRPQGAPPATPPPATPPGTSSAAPPGAAQFGQLAIRVQPPDAQLLIDGEPWPTPQGDEALVVHLPAGPHRVEIRKEGLATFSTDVRVTAGTTTPINVSLHE